MSLELEELTGKIIESAINVHKKLGSGFLESVYQSALPMELEKQGLRVEEQKEIKIFYGMGKYKTFPTTKSKRV